MLDSKAEYPLLSGALGRIQKKYLSPDNAPWNEMVSFALKELGYDNQTPPQTNSLVSRLKDVVKLLGAEDGTQIEPLTLDRLNYTMFFADREQTKLLAFQLKQLNDYLELEGYAYLR